MKKASLILLLCLVAVFRVHAQRITDFPQDATLPQGPMDFVVGEYVTWRYPFPYNAVSADGKVFTLTQWMPVIFMGAINGGFQIAVGGVTYTVTDPVHNGTSAVFVLQQISLKGVSADVVKNRLGEPDDVVKSGDTFAYIYYSEKTETRIEHRYVQSNVQGQVTIQSPNGGFSTGGYSGVTTTDVPVEKHMTYNPYAFRVSFDANGNVTGIKDLRKGTAKWESN